MARSFTRIQSKFNSHQAQFSLPRSSVSSFAAQFGSESFLQKKSKMTNSIKIFAGNSHYDFAALVAKYI